METTSGKETIIVLRSLIAYSEKIFQLSKDIVTLVSDRREKPRISTAAVVKSSLVLFWARMGSINAWEQVGRARFWQCWLEEPTFSADTLGRVHALLNANGLRQGIHDVYERLKRNKALPDIYGLGVVVLDGHESHASYLRIVPAVCSEPFTVRKVIASSFIIGRSRCCCCPVRCRDGRPCACSWIMSRSGPARMKWKRPCACWRA